jgi:phosphoribosylglycinamide formyltransferase-1
MAALKVGVLISGRGSNLQALIEACRDPATNARIVLVLSNKVDAAGLTRAGEAGIPTGVISHKAHKDRAEFDAELDRRLKAAGVELVCLAGFMRILSDGFIASWRDRLINIHPSLLPAYRGLDTHARALADGVKLAGCTVHFVRPELDAGPIIVQAAVPVADDDTPDSLAARVLVAEHRAYPLALRLLATGRIKIEAEKVILDGHAASGEILMNPSE